MPIVMPTGANKGAFERTLAHANPGIMRLGEHPRTTANRAKQTPKPQVAGSIPAPPARKL